METTIVVALVLAVVFLEGIFGLVAYSRKRSQKHTKQTSINGPNLNR